jgi:ABC-type nitrate/sulfonate/bicarbonate transport system permease component
MLGASRRLVVTHVVLPAALPAIFAGARLSLGVGWVAMVAGELVGADSGLGYRIEYFQEFFSMEGVMATIVVVGVVGYLLDLALRLLQAVLLRWSPASGASG